MGGEGAGFRASSAVRGLTNYLWNCCIHSHLNRNLSERRRGPASTQHTAEQPAQCRTTSSTTAPPPPCPPPLPPPPSFISCFSTVSRFASVSLPIHHPPPSRPSYDDGLSLMQIYNHFICRCLTPGRLQEHSSTSCFQDVRLDTASIIGLLSISRLHKSQLDGD